jgi:hypothetical protein
MNSLRQVSPDMNVVKRSNLSLFTPCRCIREVEIKLHPFVNSALD